MSLTRIILSLLVALLIGGTSLLQAEDAGTGNGNGGGNGGGNRGGIRGSITAIDLDKKTVTLKGNTGDPVVYTTNDSTKVSIDRKDATLADLKVGDNGYIRPDTTDKTLCVRISVRRNLPPGGGAGGAGGAAPAGATTPPAGQ
jgi:hypothetical protein